MKGTLFCIIGLLLSILTVKSSANEVAKGMFCTNEAGNSKVWLFYENSPITPKAHTADIIVVNGNSGYVYERAFGVSWKYRVRLPDNFQGDVYFERSATSRFQGRLRYWYSHEEGHVVGRFVSGVQFFFVRCAEF